MLRFVEENFAEVKPTIGQAEVEEKLEKSLDYEEKVVVGEIPSEEELEEDPSENKVSELVGNLAASKSVTDEPFGSDEKPEDEPESGSEANEGEESEVAAEADASDSKASEESELASGENVTEKQDSDDSASDKTADIESPTLEEGKDFVHPEASEEIKLAEEANRATEMFWDAAPADAGQSESKPEEIPAAETSSEFAADGKNDDLFLPKFELSFDEKAQDPAQSEQKTEDIPAPAFTFDDLLGKDYADPVFVKPEELQRSFETPKPAEPEAPKLEEQKEVIPISRTMDKSNVIPLNKDERGVTLNDKLSKGITIGLNDRIAFMKQLFNNSSEDYNRVLSQLITFDNFTDAKDFIDTMVKPDYENWSGKEEYEQRFLEIIEKRFQ